LRIQAVLPLVISAAQSKGLAPELVLGMIEVESVFRYNAESPVGARGLMQLMPATAEMLAQKMGLTRYAIEDPAFNITAGTTYLADLLLQFNGDFRIALAAYNAGPTRVGGWLRAGQGLPQSVEHYVEAVFRARDRFFDEGIIPPDTIQPSAPKSPSAERPSSNGSGDSSSSSPQDRQAPRELAQ
jgi:soluble lytic murein transglycosylase